MPESDEPAAVAAAADQLYGAPVDDFMALRTELAKAAKSDGDAAAAKAITGLRKPTASASVVNRYALHDPSSVERLGELGDRLRKAQRELAAAEMRELSTERRALVAEVTAAALQHAGRKDAPTGLRDEVSASFDAAVADPQIASRLGRLLRPEQFSGFGLEPGPGLTLVQGGGSRATQAPTKKQPGTRPPAEPEPDPAPAPDPEPRETATTRRLKRAADKARTAFEAADERFTSADAAEKHAQEQVHTLTDELSALQKELGEAKQELDRARREARTARSKRREALSAKDRAERQLDA